MGCACGKKTKVYDPTPDPRTGLTQRDRELITETWQILSHKKKIKQNSADFFMMLFEAHPYLQSYFVPFKDTPLWDLRDNLRFRTHAATVFYFLTSYVENIEDPETLIGLFEKIAVSHIRRGLTVDEFEKFRLVYKEYIKKSLGNTWTPEVQEAWDKLLMAHNAVYLLTSQDMMSSDDGDS